MSQSVKTLLVVANLSPPSQLNAVSVQEDKIQNNINHMTLGRQALSRVQKVCLRSRKKKYSSFSAENTSLRIPLRDVHTSPLCPVLMVVVL